MGRRFSDKCVTPAFSWAAEGLNTQITQRPGLFLRQAETNTFPYCMRIVRSCYLPEFFRLKSVQQKLLADLFRARFQSATVADFERIAMKEMRVSLLICVATLALASFPARAATVDDVIKAGVLKVCTPGDYRPFSFAVSDGVFEGLDIDLMQSLAASLAVKVEYVKTTWANLLPDFVARKCDIAVGGISVTLERQKQVSFSSAYMVNGKTPLVRCADVKRFQTVADIDKADVRVVANPGGSNERFARANFKTAKLTIHPDNLSIFDEILKGNADVFVTESAETLVQQRMRPGLCGVNPDKPLQYGEMAYLLPRGDTVTKEYVDQWLHLIKANGEYQRIAGRWLN